jgi:hypothetical protein
MAGPLEQVRYIGGPCNGKTVLYSASGIAVGTIACGGALYDVQAGTSNPVLARYNATVVTTGGVAAYSGTAYRDLLNSVRRTLPNGLVAADKIVTASLRRLGQRSRLR